MKRKKRRLDRTDVEGRGSGMKQTAEYSQNKGDKMHVLTVCDDIERFLAPSAPEIHRVRIPAAGEREGLLRRGVFSSSNQGGATLNPKPCDSKSAQNGVFAGANLLELHLTLSQEGLKGPSQVFIEGFENLLEMKFGIMALRVRHGLDTWSLGSHMVNPFEILSFVASTSVLNRAYFKMWELIQTFDLVPNVARNKRFLSAHLCEGPGGFIEAVLDYRAQSAKSEEDGQEVYDAMDREFYREDSSPVGNRTESDRKLQADDNCSFTKGSSSGTLNIKPPCVTTDVKSYPSIQNSKATICGNNPKRVHTVNAAVFVHCNESRSESPYAAELSRGNEGNQSSISEFPRPNNSLENLSNPHSIAPVSDVSEMMEGELHRADSSREADSSRDVDKSEAGCEIISCLSDVREVCMDSLSSNSSVVDRGNNISNNSWSLRSCLKASRKYHDLWFGLTLASTQQRGAGGSPPPKMEMRRLNNKMVGNSQGHVHYGVDGTGDLTNPANVSAFVDYTLGRSGGQKMDLVTSDGAFDVFEDFSSQEHSHLNLVFCEVVAALRLQAEGGSFVLKLFDCYTASTLTILFILSSLYRNVEIVRLRTTRICNSERYVVAKGFSGISPVLEEVFLRLNVEWNMASMRGDKVGVLLSGGFPEQLLQAVVESNTAISALQIDGISRALQLADVIGERLPSPDSFGRRKGSVSMLRRKMQIQKRMQRNAIALCHELHIPCRSQFSME